MLRKVSPVFLSLWVVLVMSFLDGCRSPSMIIDRSVGNHLATDATTYNLAIERAQNEMLVLNIVRSMNNWPVYITDVTKITGTVKEDLNLGLKIPFVQPFRFNTNNDLTGSPTFDFSTSPSVDVNLLNQKEFVTGFMRPIPPSLFAYLWDEGWPSELLLHMLVLRVEVIENPGQPTEKAVERYINLPESYDPDVQAAGKFAGWVRDLVANGRPILERSENPDKIGPKFGCDAAIAKGVDALRTIADDAKVALVTGPEVGQCQLTRPATSFVLHPAGVESTIDSSKESGQGRSKDLMFTETLKETGKPVTYRLTLRSPEAVLYYLGSLARVSLRPINPKILLIRPCNLHTDAKCSEGAEPLFRLVRSDGNTCPALISVTAADRNTYGIPLNTGKIALASSDLAPFWYDMSRFGSVCMVGQSTHALELVSELISLQKSATDVSTTSTVKVIGQ